MTDKAFNRLRNRLKITDEEFFKMFYQVSLMENHFDRAKGIEMIWIIKYMKKHGMDYRKYSRRLR